MQTAAFECAQHLSMRSNSSSKRCEKLEWLLSSYKKVNPTPSLKTWVLRMEAWGWEDQVDKNDAKVIPGTQSEKEWGPVITNTVCILQSCQSSWLVDGKWSIGLECEPQIAICKSITVFTSMIPSPSLIINHALPPTTHKVFTVTNGILATILVGLLSFP